MLLSLSPVTGLFSRYFSWNNGDSHRSGFKLHTAVLSVLCVMFQVQLSFVVNLSNVFLASLPNFSSNFFFIVPTHALHYTLKYEILTLKHLKFAPTCFGLLWNHLQGVHGCTSLGYWIGMLIYICYKECRYVAYVSSFRLCVCVCVVVCVCVCVYLSGWDYVMDMGSTDRFSWNLVRTYRHLWFLRPFIAIQVDFLTRGLHLFTSLLLSPPAASGCTPARVYIIYLQSFTQPLVYPYSTAHRSGKVSQFM
jgi:hypothetical protein